MSICGGSSVTGCDGSRGVVVSPEGVVLFRFSDWLCLAQLHGPEGKSG